MLPCIVTLRDELLKYPNSLWSKRHRSCGQRVALQSLVEGHVQKLSISNPVLISVALRCHPVKESVDLALTWQVLFGGASNFVFSLYSYSCAISGGPQVVRQLALFIFGV